MITEKIENIERYPTLYKYTNPVKKPEREILGREKERRSIFASFLRPELCNVILLGTPGSGKTALVQSCMMADNKRFYLEVDLSKMISELDEIDKLANLIKDMFREAASYSKDMGHEIVMFIDEFHQIIHLSRAAVEALKPILADSGTRGLRIIFATTFEEFEEFVKPNQALVERLERINIRGASKDLVIKILRGMSERYGVSNQFYNDYIFELIYEYTNRYIPANSQPRKSILVLDRMIGWHKYDGRSLDANLLADVLAESEGVNVNFKADARAIEKRLNKKILAQKFATRSVTERLFICMAGLNDETKPMGSFLFTGSTGSGKGLDDNVQIPVFDKEKNVFYKRNGDLKEGDFVFNRKGEPVEVVGVFHQGYRQCYKIDLTDGRSIITDENHLWTYMLNKGKQTANTYTNSTKELLDRGYYNVGKGGRKSWKYWIPMNEPVQYKEMDYKVDPYVIGAILGDGCCTITPLSISSNDEFVVKKISDLLGDCSYRRSSRRNYNWTFPLHEPRGQMKLKQSSEVYGSFPEMKGKKAHEKRIPPIYKYGSVSQRWSLIQGLFDTDGSIDNTSRYRVSLSSNSLEMLEDVQEVLYSLGVSSTIALVRDWGNEKRKQYRLSVKSSHQNKDRFFTLPRHLEVCEKAKLHDKETLSRKKDYDWLGITNIEPLEEKRKTTCIYVDDPEHLYQAGDFIVTHNTALAKEMTKILFEDERSFIRFDMTEFALEESLERFRDTLTNRVFENPNSIILLDEIEKAASSVTHVLLQVLDDGRLLDKYNREVSFINSYIILTTNVGADIYRQINYYGRDDEGAGVGIANYMDVIRTSLSESVKDSKFPPELLGRIDTIVPFQPLSENTYKKIAIIELEKIKKKMMKLYNMELIVTEKVLKFLVEDCLKDDSNSGGARQLMNLIDSHVLSKIGEYVSNFPNNRKCVIDVHGNIASDDKYQLKNDGVYVFAANELQSEGDR